MKICRARGRYFNLGGTKSEIEVLLENKFSREIHFSNKSFRSSHQKMSWKLAGATNFYLQRNLISSKAANLLLHSYISKAFLAFRNIAFRLLSKIQGRVKCPIFHKHVNHLICNNLFLWYLNISFCNLVIFRRYILKTSTPGIFFKT